MILDELYEQVILNEGLFNKDTTDTLQHKLNRATDGVGGRSIEELLTNMSAKITRIASGCTAKPLISLKTLDSSSDYMYYTKAFAIFYKEMIYCGDIVILDTSNVDSKKAVWLQPFEITKDFRLQTICNLEETIIPGNIIKDLITQVWNSGIVAYPKISKNKITLTTFVDRVRGEDSPNMEKKNKIQQDKVLQQFVKKYKNELKYKDSTLIYKPE